MGTRSRDEEGQVAEQAIAEGEIAAHIRVSERMGEGDAATERPKISVCFRIPSHSYIAQGRPAKRHAPLERTGISATFRRAACK